MDKNLLKIFDFLHEVENYPELKGVLAVIKKIQKNEYKKAGLSWKKEYDL